MKRPDYMRIAEFIVDELSDDKQEKQNNLFRIYGYLHEEFKGLQRDSERLRLLDDVIANWGEVTISRDWGGYEVSAGDERPVSAWHSLSEAIDNLEEELWVKEKLR